MDTEKGRREFAHVGHDLYGIHGVTAHGLLG